MGASQATLPTSTAHRAVGKRRDWLLEQVKDRPVGGVPEWLRQSFDLVPGSVREAKDAVTH